MKIEIADDHTNIAYFEGVVLYVDQYSDQPVHLINEEKRTLDEGPRMGYPRVVVEHEIPNLIGMGLNVNPRDTHWHYPRTVCGIITKAWIDDDRALRIRGIIYKNQFPDVIAAIENDELGLCPLTYNHVFYKEQEYPNCKVVIKFSFNCVGALLKKNCAFQETSIRMVQPVAV